MLYLAVANSVLCQFFTAVSLSFSATCTKLFVVYIARSAFTAVFDSSLFPVLHKFCYNQDVKIKFHQATNEKWVGKRDATRWGQITPSRNHILWSLAIEDYVPSTSRFPIHFTFFALWNCVRTTWLEQTLSTMGSVDGLKTAMNNQLNTGIYNWNIVKLLDRYDKCLNVLGGYGEK